VQTLFGGGSGGNRQLTAITASILLVLLAVEGATILRITSLLTVHAFVGMLLVPVVGLKLASASWRMARYYLHGEEYVRRGPPHLFVRALVAPVVVVSTTVLFVTGVALLALDRTSGTLVGLHKASFVVWLPGMGVHVLSHLLTLPSAIRQRLPGLGVRLGVAAAAVVCGATLATVTLSADEHLQDAATAQIGFDDR